MILNSVSYPRKFNILRQFFDENMPPNKVCMFKNYREVNTLNVTFRNTVSN